VKSYLSAGTPGDTHHTVTVPREVRRRISRGLPSRHLPLPVAISGSLHVVAGEQAMDIIAGARPISESLISRTWGACRPCHLTLGMSASSRSIALLDDHFAISACYHCWSNRQDEAGFVGDGLGGNNGGAAKSGTTAMCRSLVCLHLGSRAPGGVFFLVVDRLLIHVDPTSTPCGAPIPTTD